MPYTILCFLWRKNGTTPSEFKNHYEQNHMPLLLSLFGPQFPLKHSRFYLKRTAVSASSSDTSNANYVAAALVGEPDYFDYDVVSKLDFEDLDACQAFHAKYLDAEIAGKIAEDEEKFIERSALKVVAVDEPCVTERVAS